MSLRIRRLVAVLPIALMPVCAAFALAPDEFPPVHGASVAGGPVPDAWLASGEPRERGDDAPRSEYPPVEPLLSWRYAKLWVQDTIDVATAPARFDRDDWREAGYLGLGIAVTVAVVDRPFRDLVQRNRSSGEDQFLKDIEPFGTSRYGFPLIGGFYVYGLATDDPVARATAQDMLITSYLANTTTSIAKGLFGRARPFQGEGAHHFRPGNGDTSFPSGHTTHAFAMATVIANHYEDGWAPYVCYGVAGLVGFARIEHDKHWLSDVFGGVMVGHFIGREIVRFNTVERSEHAAMLPTVEAGADGIALNWAL